jgi:flavorubredoxin
MPVVEIKPGIYWIGVNDRTSHLFEGMWTITREGVSYNSYLIKDNKNVLIDLAKGFKADELLGQITEIIDLRDLDYIIINHMEPDHTGILNTLRRIIPEVRIIGTQKTGEMLSDFYQITENFKQVKDGETLNLGRHTLQFISTPYVHWPETMMTYELTERILFSCDCFGSYGALRGGIFDDQCKDLKFFEREALRYYANVLATFSKPVNKTLDKLSNIRVDIIAPSHGLVWRRNPGLIIELYRKWASFSEGKRESGVTLIYGSMYGNTEKMVNAIAQGISKIDIPIEIFDVTRTHISYILPSLWNFNGVIVGAPTYEGGLFPPVSHTLDMAYRKRVQNLKSAYFGSFGWGGGARREFLQFAEKLKWDVVQILEFKGEPTLEDLKKGEEFGEKFAKSLL